MRLTPVVLVAVVAVLLSGCSASTSVPAAASTPAAISEAVWVKWANAHLGCQYGAELVLPVQPWVAEGNGGRNYLVVSECQTGDSSAFSQLDVFDGRSTDSDLIHLATLVPGNYVAKQASGVMIRSISAGQAGITVIGAKYLETDPQACPSIKWAQEFAWDNGHFVAGPPKTEHTSDGGVPACQ